VTIDYRKGPAAYAGQGSAVRARLKEVDDLLSAVDRESDGFQNLKKVTSVTGSSPAEKWRAIRELLDEGKELASWLQPAGMPPFRQPRAAAGFGEIKALSAEQKLADVVETANASQPARSRRPIRQGPDHRRLEARA
jgi:hypothetical protein